MFKVESENVRWNKVREHFEWIATPHTERSEWSATLTHGTYVWVRAHRSPYTSFSVRHRHQIHTDNCVLQKVFNLFLVFSWVLSNQEVAFNAFQQGHEINSVGRWRLFWYAIHPRRSILMYQINSHRILTKIPTLRRTFQCDSTDRNSNDLLHFYPIPNSNSFSVFPSTKFK